MKTSMQNSGSDPAAQSSKRKRSPNGTYAIKRTPEEAYPLFAENVNLVPYTLKILEIEANEDNLQDGYLGLWMAALCYDATLERKFSSYAVPAIRSAIIRPWQIYQKCVQDALSLNCIIDSKRNPEDSEDNQLQECVASPNWDRPYENAELEIYLNQTLDDTERKIAKLRASGLSKKNIGEMLGHSDCWASLRLKQIKNKLKAEYAERMINLGKT